MRFLHRALPAAVAADPTAPVTPSPPVTRRARRPVAAATGTAVAGESGPVVVAIDGRLTSLNAVEWAAAEAAARDVSLRIVHVVTPDWSVDVVAGATYTWDWQLRAAALAILADAATRASAVAPHLNVTVQMRSGSTPRALRRSTGDASLLVLGRNPARRRWSSPLPDRLARHTRIPLAIIGLLENPTSDIGAHGNEHAAQVLLVLDEPAVDQAALAAAFAAAHRRGTDLVLVHLRQSGRTAQQERQLSVAVRQWHTRLPDVGVQHRRLNTMQRTDLQAIAAGASLVVLPLGTAGNHRIAIERGRALAAAPVVLIPTGSASDAVCQ